MIISDRFIKESLQTDDMPSEDSLLMISEQMGEDPDKLDVRRMRAGSSGRTAVNRRGFLTGIAAIAAVVLLAFIAVKLVPRIRDASNAATGTDTGSSLPAETDDSGPDAGTDAQKADEAPAGEGAVSKKESYLKVPVCPEILQWGMSEEEVTEVLGEPDDRKVQGSSITLAYAQPAEKVLGREASFLNVVIGRGTQISAEEMMVMGLEYITAGFDDITLEELEAGLSGFYGSYDGKEDQDHPLGQLGLNSDVVLTRYRWDDWELRAHPELLAETQRRAEESAEFMSEIQHTARSSENLYDETGMLLDISISHQKSSDEDAPQKGSASVSFDAGRYTSASAGTRDISDSPAEQMCLMLQWNHSLLDPLLQEILQMEQNAAFASEVSPGMFTLVSSPYRSDTEFLANFQALPGDGLPSDELSGDALPGDASAEPVWCTALIRVDEGKPVAEAAYVYRLDTPEAKAAYDLLYDKFDEVYEGLELTDELLSEGMDAAVDHFMQSEELFDDWSEEEKTQLRNHLQTGTIRRSAPVFGDVRNWILKDDLSFMDPRFIVCLDPDEELLSEEISKKTEDILDGLDFAYLMVCQAEDGQLDTDIIRTSEELIYRQVPLYQDLYEDGSNEGQERAGGLLAEEEIALLEKLYGLSAEEVLRETGLTEEQIDHRYDRDSMWYLSEKREICGKTYDEVLLFGIADQQLYGESFMLAEPARQDGAYEFVKALYDSAAELYGEPSTYEDHPQKISKALEKGDDAACSKTLREEWTIGGETDFLISIEVVGDIRLVTLRYQKHVER